MSKAITQNATDIAVSPEQNCLKEFPFKQVLVKIAAMRFSSASMVAKVNTHKQSLRDSLKNEFCATFPQVFNKGHVPVEVWDVICATVEEFLTEQLTLVNTSNIVSCVSRYHYNAKAATAQGKFTLQHTLVGRDGLELKAARMACIHLITDAVKREEKLALATPYNADMHKASQAKLMSLKADLAELEAEIVRQQVS